MTETDITILSLSEAGRAALAKLAALDALCEQQTRTIALTSERAVKAEKERDALSRTVVAMREACRRNLDAARDDHDAAIRSRDEVGIQYAAAQARLRLAMAVVDAARGVTDGPLSDALRALDAVPGDALATP